MCACARACVFVCVLRGHVRVMQRYHETPRFPGQFTLIRTCSNARLYPTRISGDSQENIAREHMPERLVGPHATTTKEWQVSQSSPTIDTPTRSSKKCKRNQGQSMVHPYRVPRTFHNGLRAFSCGIKNSISRKDAPRQRRSNKHSRSTLRADVAAIACLHSANTIIKSPWIAPYHSNAE